MEIKLEEENKKFKITLTGNQLELLDSLLDDHKKFIEHEHRYDHEVRRQELSKLQRISHNFLSVVVEKRKKGESK
jgi:hypothetical protein